MYPHGPNASYRFPWATVAKCLAGLVVALILFGALWNQHGLRGWLGNLVQPESETFSLHSLDPRLTFETPFRNVRPDVKYVGDKVCAACHVTEAQSYRHHPMGRSLAPVGVVASKQHYEKDVANPFHSVGFEFAVEKRGKAVFHDEIGRDAAGEEISRTSQEVQYAVGSGTHAYSYLIQRGDRLFQSPITWFSQKKAWDLSPGFTDRRDRFERPILPGCLFCHCNQAFPVADTLNRYEEPVFQGYTIGCERCHGPGELHVALREKGEIVEGVDTSIVNPHHLAPRLRDSVCEQCHLGGKARLLPRGRKPFDYRPGLPFDLFWTVFVKPSTEEIRVAGHVEQMAASRCFQASEGKLGCVSCHDPHRLPEERESVNYYREQCLKCHGESIGKVCSEPSEMRRKKSPEDNCMECHMPRVSTNITHVALTDHRIPRRPSGPAPSNAPAPESPWVHFHRNKLDLLDPDMARDLWVALIDHVRNLSDPATRLDYSGMALPLLESAARAHPNDIPAGEALGLALGIQGRPADALANCENVLARAPGREVVLADAAMISQMLKQNDASLGYWQRALDINPWSSRYRYEVANLLAERGEWDKAEAECRKVLESNASHQKSRMLLVEYEIHKGNKEKAQTGLKNLVDLYPKEADNLRAWFSRLPQRK